MITNIAITDSAITVTKDDGSTVVYTPEAALPTPPQVINVPLDTPIELHAE